MTRSSGVPTGTPDRKEYRRVLLSSYLGSAIEYYDFLLYVAAASLIFADLFFSGLSPAMSTIASLGTLAVGYVSRPLGAAFFGHFGDRYGRKKVLITTLVVMGLATTLIGLLPTVKQVGMWSPLLLILLRLIQGFSVGGEWGGAALMAFEHAPKHRRGLAASFSAAGGPTGTMLAAAVLGLCAKLPTEDFQNWGWRIPFLVSFFLVGFGLWMRLRVAESPMFLHEQAKRAKMTSAPKPPLLEILRAPRALVLSLTALLSNFTLNSLAGTIGLSFAKSTGMSISQILGIQAVSALLCGISEVLSGYLSDIYGRRVVMGFGMVVGALFAWPFMQLISTGGVVEITIAFVVMYALVLGPIGGPCPAYLAEQFGTSARYTGASLGYQAAATIGGGFGPVILAALVAAQSGSFIYVVGFVAVVSVISLVAFFITTRSAVLLADDASIPMGASSLAVASRAGEYSRD